MKCAEPLPNHLDLDDNQRRIDGPPAPIYGRGMRPLHVVLPLMLLASLACLRGRGDDEGGSSAGDGGADLGGNQAPEVLSFTAGPSRISEGGETTFTAVVTDSDGVDDVIGGTLESQSGATFGGFSSTGASGTFEIDLTWRDIDEVESIEFDSTEDRLFVASFYDAAGKTGTATVALNLHCDGDGACEGRCVDLDSDRDNCGECGNACQTCDAGECLEWTCTRVTGDILSCDDACGSNECLESEPNAGTWFIDSNDCADGESIELDRCSSQAEEGRGSVECLCAG